MTARTTTANYPAGLKDQANHSGGGKRSTPTPKQTTIPDAAYRRSRKVLHKHPIAPDCKLKKTRTELECVETRGKKGKFIETR